MSNKNKAIALLVAAIVALLFWVNYQQNVIDAAKYDLQQAKIKVDTIYVKKPYKIETIKYVDRAVPYQVKVYVQDTNLRKAVQDTDIITHVSITKGGLFNRPKLIIDKITPKGFVYQNFYNTKDFKSINIDNTGEVSIKRKRRNIYLKIGIPVVCIGLGFIALQQSKYKIENFSWHKQ